MRLYFRQLINSKLWQTNQSRRDVGKPFVTLVRRHPSKSWNHFRVKKDQSFNHPPWRFPSAFTAGLRSPRQEKRLVRRRERKSCRYSSQVKKSLSLSLRSRAQTRLDRVGPLLSAVHGAARSPRVGNKWRCVFPTGCHSVSAGQIVFNLSRRGHSCETRFHRVFSLRKEFPSRRALAGHTLDDRVEWVMRSVEYTYG